MKTLLLLSLAIATTFSFQTPVHAQGGTLITEASALGYLGYSGYYGDELAAIEDGTGSYDLLIAETASNAQVHVRDGLTGVESASIPSPGRSLSAVPDVDGDGRAVFVDQVSGLCLSLQRGHGRVDSYVQPVGWGAQ